MRFSGAGFIPPFLESVMPCSSCLRTSKLCDGFVACVKGKKEKQKAATSWFSVAQPHAGWLLRNVSITWRTGFQS